MNQLQWSDLFGSTIRSVIAAILIFHVWSWTGLFIFWLAATVLNAFAKAILKRLDK